MMDKTAQEIGYGTKKPILLFLHYFGGSSQSWKWLIDELGSAFDGIAVDLPGFGREKPFDLPDLKKYSAFIRTLMNQTSERPYVLIGHSMGGKIAVQAAIDDTYGKIIKLILIAPSPPSVEPIPSEKRKTMCRHPDEAKAMSSVKGAIKLPLSDDKLRVACQTEQQIDIRTRKWWVDTGTSSPVSADARNLDVPVNLILSKQDPAISYGTSLEQSVKNLPASASVFLNEKSGHLIPLEDTEWLASVIQEILAKE